MNRPIQKVYFQVLGVIQCWRENPAVERERTQDPPQNPGECGDFHSLWREDLIFNSRIWEGKHFRYLAFGNPYVLKNLEVTQNEAAACSLMPAIAFQSLK